jgi:hypothetical protein
MTPIPLAGFRAFDLRDINTRASRGCRAGNLIWLKGMAAVRMNP